MSEQKARKVLEPLRNPLQYSQPGGGLARIQPCVSGQQWSNQSAKSAPPHLRRSQTWHLRALGALRRSHTLHPQQHARGIPGDTDGLSCRSPQPGSGARAKHHGRSTSPDRKQRPPLRPRTLRRPRKAEFRASSSSLISDSQTGSTIPPQSPLQRALHRAYGTSLWTSPRGLRSLPAPQGRSSGIPSRTPEPRLHLSPQATA
mmetsp:Transcript_27432/g.59984  ORF Transcript_27432/g.59984 Transcript_27432/m.59984 type:complete len:202 (+) Transcript_27432:1181-1786(+)